MAQCLNPQVVLLDVRTAAEFNDFHLPNAVNIDIKQPDFTHEIAELDPQKTYLVYCSLGKRSANACLLMRQMGFNKVFNLKGGLQSAP
ncbi:rhodanese-like domain-containing protein [Sphingobacteriales bacterium UPWRP_1]|nr:hypothetical protein BVG80_03040 [Sphingobacteriales bacterium TSM_CSM]PSJ75465.1 rhodanese-like domain-containing protein [Sphingobacteriales bacterium UPWRP_1]